MPNRIARDGDFRVKLEQAPPRFGQRPRGSRSIGVGSPLPPDIDIVAEIFSGNVLEGSHGTVLNRRVGRLERFSQHWHGLLITEVANGSQRVQPNIDVIIATISVGEVPHRLGTTNVDPGIAGCHSHHCIGVIQSSDTDCPSGIVVKVCRDTDYFRPDAGVMLGKHRPDEFLGVGSLNGRCCILGIQGLLPQFLDSLVGRQTVTLFFHRKLFRIFPRQGPGTSDGTQTAEKNDSQPTPRPGLPQPTASGRCHRSGHNERAFITEGAVKFRWGENVTPAVVGFQEQTCSCPSPQTRKSSHSAQSSPGVIGKPLYYDGLGT